MATVKNVIGALNGGRDRSTPPSRSVSKLMNRHKVGTQRQLVNHYNKNGGLKALVGELNEQELRKSLTVLSKSELQMVVYGALAFDSKLEALIPDDGQQGNSRKLRGIMEDLCGWHVDTFQQVTYDSLIQMLNRFGVDVEERELEHLEKDGRKGKNKAADRKVRLLRMFVD